MAGINYTALTRRVRKLLARNGAPYSVKRAGMVSRDSTGQEFREDDIEYSAVGILTSFSVFEMAGSAIETGDMKFICVIPPTEEMRIGDVVEINGTHWRVEDPRPVMPKATAMCYIAQVRLV